jgi:AcrR family transcriptional regulator
VVADQHTYPRAATVLRPFQIERRQRIVDAGLRLLYDNDPDQVQVRDVAVEAGFALGTIYRYFNTKDQLLAAVQLGWMEQLHQRVISRTFRSRSDAARMREVLFRSVRSFDRWPQFYKTLNILENSTDPVVQEMLAQLVELSFETYGAALQDVAPAQRPAILRTLMAVLASSLRAWVTGRLPISAVYAKIDESIALVLPGG